MENISDINTVQDLLKANEEVNEDSISDTICKEIFNHEPAVGLEVVKKVLVELAQFHVDVANNKIDEKDESTPGWIKDATVLRIVSDMIEEVDLWYNKYSVTHLYHYDSH